MNKFNLDKAVNDVAKYQQIQIKGKGKNMNDVKYDSKKHLDVDELKYYMSNCDGFQFKKDIFSEDRFVDSYVTGKFTDFRDRFPSFLASLSNTYKTRFCIAVHEFYQNNHKEK